ncbi:FUSC family protein [Paenibacillus sp. RC67]|uniref:FUSC family protein n=1 Tax=Paenibacillus sp. RC67 TaxID=3039392 RepID=UPI0024AD8100|nr:FUSC family protein [Paenibacillus sp. RC67]
MDSKKHLTQALHWSKEAEVDLAEIISSCIGMAGPVVLFAAMGYLQLGLVASLGSLAVGGVKGGSNLRNLTKEWAFALLPAVLASVLAFLLIDHGWLSDTGVILLAILAAMIGGYSRELIVSTTRFILFLTIAINVFSAAPHAAELLLFILAGAIWRTILSFVLDRFLSWKRRNDASPTETLTPSALQKFKRWKRSLTQLSGWQYTLRLGLCLCAAEGLRWLWPNHHFYWIVLTVAILIERKIDPIPIKTIQRVLGTVIGVIVVSSIFLFTLPVWVVIVIIGLLAALRPLLKVRNYLLYSATMTPLIFLLMGAGQTIEFKVLIDRVMATLIGACLVILVNLLFNRVIPKQA